jgi:hypothetical protein
MANTAMDAAVNTTVLARFVRVPAFSAATGYAKNPAGLRHLGSRHRNVKHRLALWTCREIDPAAANRPQYQRLLFAEDEASRARIRFHGAQMGKPGLERVDLDRVNHSLAKVDAERAFQDGVPLSGHMSSLGSDSERHHRACWWLLASERLSS